jgi:hypothetical protein
MRNGKSRDDLAREANEVRAQLMRTVEQLDQRRRDAGDIPLQFKRHARLAAVMGALALLATASAAALVARRLAARPARRRRNRWRLAKQMWRHPERALRAQPRSPFDTLAYSVLKSLLGTIATVCAQRLVATASKPATGAPPRPA